VNRKWSYDVFVLLPIICLIMIGCQHTISETLRQQADPAISFEALRKEPDAFKGRTVILGGDILKTQNAQQRTSIEILQKPLDHYEAPLITDQTAGRFIAQCDQYLDPAIYDRGRQITVAGKVLGSYAGQVGEADYLYPLITCGEVHLWPRVSQEPVYPHPWLLYRYHPWYRYPYYDDYDWPFLYRYHYRRHR
jgi:outer membrane lipoprotein